MVCCGHRLQDALHSIHCSHQGLRPSHTRSCESKAIASKASRFSTQHTRPQPIFRPNGQKPEGSSTCRRQTAVGTAPSPKWSVHTRDTTSQIPTSPFSPHLAPDVPSESDSRRVSTEYEAPRSGSDFFPSHPGRKILTGALREGESWWFSGFHRQLFS